MKYVAAYALLVLGGKDQPTSEDLSNLLKEVGIDAQKEDLKTVVDALKGKKLADVIAEGLKSVQTLSAGGAAAPAQSAPKAAEVKKDEPKKVEKAPEPVEEDVDMGGLFD